MKKETLEYIKKNHMIEQGDGVIVGLSGGADSVCLLHVLWCLKEELGIGLRAVHVHHGLRGEEADRDAAFSETFCRERDIPFKLVKIRASEEAKAQGISVEEAGRLARYRILEEEALSWEKERRPEREPERRPEREPERRPEREPERRPEREPERRLERETNRAQEKKKAGTGKIKIATAHHGNDSAETILHNLFRGTGLTGLSGIAPVRGRIIRPVLWAGREDIVDWLRSCKIEYVEDSTNRENDYTRNKIRNELMPVITSSVNGQAVRNILRVGERIREADEYLEKTARNWIVLHGADGQAGFSVPELLKEDRIIRSYVVRALIRSMGCSLKDITAVHIDSVLDLMEKGTGKEVDLPYGLKAENVYGRIKFSRRGDKPEIRDESAGERDKRGNAVPRLDIRVFPFQNQAEIPKNQYTKWFDYDKIKDTLSVRNRRTGDYITLASGGRKTVKSFMIDEKIPREKRSEILLLAEGSHVLWIVGYRISEYYKVTEQTKNILQVQLDGGTDSGR